MKLFVSTLLAVCVAASTGCVEHRSLTPRTSSFKVVVSGGHGTKDQRLPFPETPVPADVTVTALLNTGGIDTGFNGKVKVFAAPGHVQTADGRPNVTVTLKDGKGTGSLDMAGIYGDTFVCMSDEDRPNGSTYSAGCSNALYFEMPTLRQIQQTTDSTVGPLDGDFLQVSKGDLIVTGIFSDGFYITDLAEPPISGMPGNFASIYIYSYSYPDDLQIGDRLDSVIGTVQEFTGDTQITFPSWVRKDVPTNTADLPTPVEITPAICAASGTGDTGLLCGHSTSNLALESLESAVVIVKNVKTPTRWVNCDLNEDGTVLNYDPTCTANDPRISCQEIACNTDCNKDLTCSELSSYKNYGQWAVSMAGGAGPKINVITRDGDPQLDPTLPANQGILLDVTGNLRQSLPARPRWIVVARTGGDVVRR